MFLFGVLVVLGSACLPDDAWSCVKPHESQELRVVAPQPAPGKGVIESLEIDPGLAGRLCIGERDRDGKQERVARPVVLLSAPRWARPRLVANGHSRCRMQLVAGIQ